LGTTLLPTKKQYMKNITLYLCSKLWLQLEPPLHPQFNTPLDTQLYSTFYLPLKIQLKNNI
jgi:hypothetical protein